MVLSFRYPRYFFKPCDKGKGWYTGSLDISTTIIGEKTPFRYFLTADILIPAFQGAPTTIARP